MERIADVVKPGVVTGSDLQYIFKVAQKNKFALPAVNVVSSSSTNAVMEAAKAANAPVMIQFSNGGAAFYAGKGLTNENQAAAVAGPDDPGKPTRGRVVKREPHLAVVGEVHGRRGAQGSRGAAFDDV